MAVSAQPLSPQRPGLIVRILRGIGWFLLIPIVAAAALAALLWWQVTEYQSMHEERIFTGVSIANIDLSGLGLDEARAEVAVAAPLRTPHTITLVDPRNGESWMKNSAELGISYDYDSLLDDAYAIGRGGDQEAQLREQFDTWYYGVTLNPNTVVDEQYLDHWLDEVAARIDQPPVDATLDVIADEVVYTPGQVGYTLDRVAMREQMVPALYGFDSAEISLTINEIQPNTRNLGDAAAAIQHVIGSPVHFYFEQPLDGVDLQGISLPTEKLSEWMRIEWIEVDGQSTPNVYLDEAAATEWVSQFRDEIYQHPVRARFYFDDLTRELVLVEPHVDGRQLHVAKTVENLVEAVSTPNRSVALAISPIVPEVHSGVTGAELGIVENVVEATTSFAGSSPERMANIARSAENFYGIVVAPGEEFSFNQYLGEISAEQGYETGLIIFGGQTIEGIGGGVCQVSTTLYQAAFWAGLSIGSRVPHGYRVSYYENALALDGRSNIGMDATIYSPIIDMTFTNNTDHHLLIENYYRAESRSLTFKFYSTDIGRKVSRNINIWNETPPKPDVYRFNPALAGTEFKQVEWATGGASVEIHRVVTNAEGSVRDENFLPSTYVPWGNVYEFGPAMDRSLIPADAEVQG